ncbi:MAG: hypothetical protein VW547_09755 [Alphaproteobacteria bacterium]|jgi:hypothetical protein
MIIVLRDDVTGNYVRADGPLPALVDLPRATRFANRGDASLVLMRLPLTILARAVEVAE